MGKKNNNPTVTQSSIALLQERFRHLQRVKEMREERENQRSACSQGERLNLNAQCAQPTWFIHPDLVRPSMPLRGPPSCWLDKHGDHTELQALESSLSMSLWPNQTTAQHQVTSNEPDVDTTLHL
ncbi:hypothetical protein Cni_G01086 [Canna indica]|uniref:Uncharacterized protein n=1 Tax=Canna indica TaxID=4628 RepID=A0AAQ3Q0K2_9LILI|nr:hypothetical protein Cni_G01086 [Canna indica]